MKERAIIIGSSTTGKTTLLNYLRGQTDIPLGESDDVLIEMNGGTYPKDSDYKMNTLSPKMVGNILAMDKIIFFSNSDYFRAEDLEIAHKRRFRVMLLKLDREIMYARNKYRMAHQGYDDLSIYFDAMQEYEEDMQNKKLIDIVIDTNRDIKVIGDEILLHLAEN